MARRHWGPASGPARELTGPVSLTTAEGRLNPDAVGWARHPLVDTSDIARPARGSRLRIPTAWGRNKRWEYWGVITPGHILALTISSIDYAAVHEVWILERESGRQWHRAVTAIGGVELPGRLDAGPARARAKDLQIDVEPIGRTRQGVAAGVALRASIPGASFALEVTRPAGHEALAVVVPWSPTRFQYTVKEVALPVTGTLTLEGRTSELAPGWAVLDHGRGRWPYDVRWNWGAGSGRSHGRVIGLQVGGQWTEGTGQTENALFVDGVMHKIHEQLRWRFDPAEPMRPWSVSGGGLEASFTPFHLKRSRTALVVLSSRTDQCFGTWSGSMTTAAGERITFDGLLGWAEDVHNRW